MTSEDVKREGDKDEDHSIPAFGVSGQFMMTSEEKAVPSEDFNPRKIVALTLDDSLARLFECLTLEYSGSILLTPKWKNFRSQKLKFSEKTRINNAIWRSWHIQFQEDKRPLFCQFDNPLTEMAKKPRPVTLMIEGKYWKRKLEAVAAEYQKWRVFYKHMVEDKFQDVELRHQTEEILRLDQEISHNLRTREKKRQYPVANHEAQRSGPEMGSPLSLVVSQALEMVDSCNLMENMVFSLPDTLFSSLADNQAVGRVRTGTFKDTADTVQPTLDTLQPSLEAMTPVLDELIEQLEASMKGSAEFSWDFDSLEKSYDAQMGLVHSSSAADVVEPMDHSGRYAQPYVPIGTMPPVSTVVKPSWSTQTSNVLTPSMFPASSGSHLEAQLPIWTSAPVIHPNVIGYQTIGNNMPGNFTLQGNTSGSSREQRLANVPTSLADIRGSTSGTTSRPYVPPHTDIGKRLPTSPSACAFEASAGRMPRNSSDSQLYLLAAGDSTPFKSRAHSALPVELQAPNLVAQLKLTKPRQMLIEETAKRLRIPRNKSAPGLASLDSTAQLKKTPQVGGVRAKRLGRIPRNRSDSALASLIRQTEQSTSRVRRDSESGDSPPTMRVSSSLPTGRQGPTSPAKRQLYHPGGEEAARPSSQLVNDMVTHLMSKGISVEEILNKLTSMAAAGTVPQAQAISHQITSAASNMVCMLQQRQLAQQLTPLPTLAPPYPTSPPVVTPTDTPKVTTPRSRRKPQIPRPSAKAARTESPAINDTSGILSNESIVQSLLAQNRQMATNSRIPTIDSRKSASLASNPMWGDATSAFVNHGTAAHTLAHMSEPLRLQDAGSTRQYPIILETSTLAETDKPPVSKRSARADTGNLSAGYLSSMVISTASTSTARSKTSTPSSSTSKTKVSDEANIKDDPSTPSTSGTESQKTRTGPLTKTLPKAEYQEHRRKVHVSAEQKRRGHIKMGFEQLVEMVPALASEGEKKISKATVLKKSVDYILKVQQEHENMLKERERLKREIENLNIEISDCQKQLPETGVLVNKQDFSELEALFNYFIQERTEQNPKFWIFSVLMRPIFDTYNSSVSTTSPEEFYRTILNWLNESCSLPKLRPSVLASLREIIKNTTILSDPSKFPEQARLAASALGSQSTIEGLPR